MSPETAPLKRLVELAAIIGNRQNTDILLYSGPIGSPTDDGLIFACKQHERRRNVMLLLTTNGGDAAAAYRMARCLQRGYEQFVVYIDTYCKSAGTLLALGAHEIIMSDHGELGPLDVQVYRPDEIGRLSSGLTPLQALNTLRSQAFSAFEQYFLALIIQSGAQITTKRAAEIASNMAIGLFTPIYAQIDPMGLGELDRAVRIALDYGNRLGQQNLKDGALERLVAGYPSHDFVIDREEAEELFHHVRAPRPDEEELLRVLGPILAQLTGERPFEYLDDILNVLTGNDAGEHDAGQEHVPSGPAPPTERSAGSSTHRADDARADAGSFGQSTESRATHPKPEGHERSFPDSH